ncbi:MAG: hypothetical protein R3E32_27405 [Chitinophagales bacterium]
MKTSKIFFTFVAIALMGFFFTQTTYAQKRKSVGGKDLVITWAELIPNGDHSNNRAPYKVNFKVRNYGTQAVQARTRVALNLVQYPLNSNNGQVIKSLLADRGGSNFDNFETRPLASNEEHSYTAYVPNGFPVGYRYQVEIKVDACLDEPDAAPCRVAEAIENNNHYRLPDLTLNPKLTTKKKQIPSQGMNLPDFGTPIFTPNADLVNGKDLRITEAEMIALNRNNSRESYKVNFKVKNFGTQAVQARTQVAINLVQYPLNNNQGRVIKSLLADRGGSNFDNFEISPLVSNEEKAFTAYVPNGLPIGYRYQLEIKVDACLDAPDAAPCRVVETSEINNHFQLPELTIR